MGTIHTGYVRLLFACLEDRGIDLTDMYGRRRLEEIKRVLSDARMPIQEWDALMAAADERLYDHDVALMLAEFAKPMDTGPLGFLAMSARTLREATEMYEQFFGVLNDVCALKMVMQDGCMCTSIVPIKGRRSVYLERLTLGIMCWQGRWLARREDLRFDVQCAFPAPAKAIRPVYDRTFGGELRFNADVTVLRAPPGAGDLVVSHGDHGVQEVLRTQLLARLAEASEDTPHLIQEVERLIQKRMSEGEVLIEDVAREVGMPIRTLQFRLQSYGLSFRCLTDRTRHALALVYIANPKIPLIDVADMLGFASQSSFIRAFRRWTNLSPSQYRGLKGDKTH